LCDGRYAGGMEKTVFLTYNQIDYKQKFKNYSGISPLNACYKLCSNTINKKIWKHKHSFWKVRIDSEKADVASTECLA
jgi:hypothetical protein